MLHSLDSKRGRTFHIDIRDEVMVDIYFFDRFGRHCVQQMMSTQFVRMSIFSHRWNSYSTGYYPTEISFISFSVLAHETRYGSLDSKHRNLRMIMFWSML
jgi:hypothetical protein